MGRALYPSLYQINTRVLRAYSKMCAFGVSTGICVLLIGSTLWTEPTRALGDSPSLTNDASNVKISAQASLVAAIEASKFASAHHADGASDNMRNCARFLNATAAALNVMAPHMDGLQDMLEYSHITTDVSLSGERLSAAAHDVSNASTRITSSATSLSASSSMTDDTMNGLAAQDLEAARSSLETAVININGTAGALDYVGRPASLILAHNSAESLKEAAGDLNKLRMIFESLAKALKPPGANGDR